MYTMVDEIDRFHPDLIIGPVYGSVYKALMDDLTNKNIPVIYPLSSRSEEFGVYPDFIQVNPSMKALTVAMSDWLREEAEEMCIRDRLCTAQLTNCPDRRQLYPEI